MKISRSDVQYKAHAIPELEFENQSLTSFAGLILFQQLFAVLHFKARLRDCFRYVNTGKVFGRATIFLQLIVHILVGFRELRDSHAYRDTWLVADKVIELVAQHSPIVRQLILRWPSQGVMRYFSLNKLHTCMNEIFDEHPFVGLEFKQLTHILV